MALALTRKRVSGRSVEGLSPSSRKVEFPSYGYSATAMNRRAAGWRWVFLLSAGTGGGASPTHRGENVRGDAVGSDAAVLLEKALARLWEISLMSALYHGTVLSCPLPAFPLTRPFGMVASAGSALLRQF